MAVVEKEFLGERLRPSCVCDIDPVRNELDIKCDEA